MINKSLMSKIEKIKEMHSKEDWSQLLSAVNEAMGMTLTQSELKVSRDYRNMPSKDIKEHNIAQSSPLLAYRKNIKSQHGEDGVIAEIFDRIGERSRWCVEFGAWDGMHLSNTWNLIHNNGWSSVQIEGDEARAKELSRNYADNPNVHCKQAWVNDQNPLDMILSQTPIPKDFDLLSIDINGDDYWAWRACKQYRPRVVIIETNPTFGHELNFIQNKGNCIGSSMKAMVELGKSKGYELAAYTNINCIFVTNEDFPSLCITDNSCELMFHSPYVPRLISDYNGNHYILQTGPWGLKNIFFEKDLKKAAFYE